MEHIAVLDFGSQYSHLISRRIRDLGACAEVFSSTVSLHKLKHTKGIILSGAAYSVYDKRAPTLNKKILQLGIPILGICYGHQVIAHSKNGVVAEGESGEYGLTDLVAKKSVLLNGLNKKEKVWMNHMDVVKSLPKNFIITGSTEHSPVAVFENEKENIYGVQFHPEVTHTRKGNTILSNFIFTICNCEKNWNSKTLIDDIVEEAKKTIGDKKAIIGLSGGIDSSVAAALVSQAIGKKLTAVYVDTGLMRTYETEFLKEAFSDVDLTLKIVKAGAEFFRKLKGVTSPERKRKIIGMVTDPQDFGFTQPVKPRGKCCRLIANRRHNLVHGCRTGRDGRMHLVQHVCLLLEIVQGRSKIRARGNDDPCQEGNADGRTSNETRRREAMPACEQSRGHQCHCV